MADPIRKLAKVLTLNPVVTTSAYSAGNQVGALLTVKDFFESLSGVSELISIEISDNSNQKAAFSLVIFGAKPAGTFADATAFAPSAADLKLISAIIAIPSANYTTFNASNAAGQVSNIRAKIQAALATQQIGPNSIAKNAYIALVTSGTPTYAVSTDLQLKLGIEQDI